MIETDDGYPLPDGCDDIIAAAATAMRDAHAARTATAEAYVAARREAIYASLDAMRAEREATA